ncbi:hypothetical protein Efla_000151 [Eimeria flavescens]
MQPWFALDVWRRPPQRDTAQPIGAAWPPPALRSRGDLGSPAAPPPRRVRLTTLEERQPDCLTTQAPPAAPFHSATASDPALWRDRILHRAFRLESLSTARSLARTLPYDMLVSVLHDKVVQGEPETYLKQLFAFIPQEALSPSQLHISAKTAQQFASAQEAAYEQHTAGARASPCSGGDAQQQRSNPWLLLASRQPERHRQRFRDLLTTTCLDQQTGPWQAIAFVAQQHQEPSRL